MNLKGFVAALVVSLLLLIYAGQKFLFFTDYMAFTLIFAAASLILTVAAVLCKAAQLSPPKEETNGMDDR